jgi:hypothetical protein
VGFSLLTGWAGIIRRRSNSARRFSIVAIEPLVGSTKEHLPDVSLKKWFSVDEISKGRISEMLHITALGYDRTS